MATETPAADTGGSPGLKRGAVSFGGVLFQSIGQLSKHLPSAGAFYTFVSHGIHPKVGFLVAWGFLLGVIVPQRVLETKRVFDEA